MKAKLSTYQRSALRSGIKRGMLRAMQNNETSDATLCIFFHISLMLLLLLQRVYAKVAQLC